MQIEYVSLLPSEHPPDLGAFRPFKCVVIVSAVVTNEWRNQISEWLVNSGCLYMMAWGTDCSLWDDSVDWTVLEEFDYGVAPEDRTVWTTWHPTEPLSEVLFFAKHCSDHDAIDLQNLLFLDIGKSGRGDDLKAQFAKA